MICPSFPSPLMLKGELKGVRVAGVFLNYDCDDF